MSEGNPEDHQVNSYQVEEEKEDSKRRGIWTPEEDRVLYEAVSKHGTDWMAVAGEKGLQAKSSKQCRERWIHHGNPQLNKSDFTEEETKKIFEAHKEYGNRWVKIAQQLNNRSDNAVKNYFYARVRHELKRINNGLREDCKFKRLHLTSSTYLRLLKRINMSVLDTEKFSPLAVGNMLLDHNVIKKRKARNNTNGQSATRTRPRLRRRTPAPAPKTPPKSPAVDSSQPPLSNLAASSAAPVLPYPSFPLPQSKFPAMPKFEPPSQSVGPRYPLLPRPPFVTMPYARPIFANYVYPHMFFPMQTTIQPPQVPLHTFPVPLSSKLPREDPSSSDKNGKNVSAQEPSKSHKR